MSDRIHKLLADALTASIKSGHKMRIPDGAHLIWQWFLDLNRTRTYHNAGPNPITYSEILAYTQLTGAVLRPKDIMAIRRLDDTWIATIYEMRDKPNSKTNAELHTGAFDALFS